MIGFLEEKNVKAKKINGKKGQKNKFIIALYLLVSSFWLLQEVSIMF